MSVPGNSLTGSGPLLAEAYDPMSLIVQQDRYGDWLTAPAEQAVLMRDVAGVLSVDRTLELWRAR